MEKFTYLKSSNADYIEELFAKYQQDPDTVDPSWRYFFDGLEFGAEALPPLEEEAAPGIESGALSAEAKVAELIAAYRSLGHLIANVNPLSPAPASHPLLDLGRFGLSNADLPKTFKSGNLLGLGSATLERILARLREIYLGSVGAEYAHIQDPAEREWVRAKLESATGQEPEAETRRLILKRLTESETFEKFLHTRYVAQKRFSVEGGEAFIPMLDCMIEQGAELGAQEFVIGMAHRGRLNVLTNVLGKKPELILTEFEGAYKPDPSKGEGDVKYHMGFSADFSTRRGKKVHLSLASNPSHLEFVGAVVEGAAHAKQALLGDEARDRVVPILVHGDAALAGQGICYETVQLSRLKGYTTGGTLHIVINNQVGFTTSPEDSRSTVYSTDLAKTFDLPVFHVNGDDPDAVWRVAALCTEYRKKFHKDVFIDLVCYRKHGHNEGDEPSFTQPLLYRKIKSHPSVRELYSWKLEEQGVLGSAEAQKLVDDVMARLTEAQARTRAEAPTPYVSAFEGRWKNFKRPSHEDLFKPVKTAISEKTLGEISEKINRVPAGFHLHPKLVRLFEARLKAVEEGKGIDWGNGEALAYASLAIEGHPIRLTGQDAERGTFTHRHAILNDFETGTKYCPINHIRDGQALMDIHNSDLSETGVLGFEYGYSLTDPNALVVWEAQFGDFANGAQVIIDQFISATESKWKRVSGLVLLLPHGYEGQGAEHSSARLERFLQLCGRDNLIVANLTTPANIFHALRRQVLRDFRKPLVVMSPKSLLRHPQAVSDLADFSKGSFEEVIDDPSVMTDSEAGKIKKVVLCSGKVYYDLAAERLARNSENTAIIRVEQLYPWPAWKLADILARYKGAQTIVWAQEEPRNMGAWTYVFNLWAGGYGFFQKEAGNRPIQYAGREIAAAPAVSSHKLHEHEQKALVEKALS